MFKILSKTVIQCEQYYSISFLWKIYKLNQSNLSQPGSEINITNNPTLIKTELTIIGNTFEYGLYYFLFTVTIQINVGNYTNIQSIFESEAYTYIKIIPSGIIVSGLPNSNNYLIIGKSQSVDINPVLNSFDMDYLIKTTQLKFKFFCFQIDKLQTLPSDLRTFDTSDSNDLYNNRNNPCFPSRSKTF